MESGAGTGAIYQIEAVSPSPTPTPTPSPTSPPNQPPVLQPIADQTVDEGQALSVQAVASDPDGNSIRFSLGPGAPPGSSIGASTGLFTWTPNPYSSTGTYSMTVVATDNGSPPLPDSQSFTIDVLAVNHPPSLNPIPTQLAELGQPVEVLVSRYASDPDMPAQTLTYSLGSGAPAGAIFDPSLGRFAWTVPPGQPLGPETIGVTVTDNGSPPMSTSGSFTIDVVPYTPPPVFPPIAGRTVDEGVPLTVQAAATDSPGIAITYALGPGARPARRSTRRPAPSPGRRTRSRAPGPIRSRSWPRRMARCRRPPRRAWRSTCWRSTTRRPSRRRCPRRLVGSGRALQFGVAGYVSDPDRPAQTLTYSLAPGAPAGASIDPASGLITWVTAPGQHIGGYSFGVIVTDAGSPPLSVTTGLAVNVYDPGPAATIVQARVSRKHGLAIALRFSQPLDPSTAADLADYSLVAVKKSKKGPPAAVIPLTASYNASSRTVTLAAQTTVKRGQALRLTLMGGTAGLLKITGLPLAGDGVHAGTSYVAAITGTSIRQTDAARVAKRSRAAAEAQMPSNAHHPAGPLASITRGTRK